MDAHTRTPRIAAWGALLVGLGLGGFFDGIVLHQVLQWHHMICTTETCQPRTVAELQYQNFTDGLFHAGCLVLTVVGVAMIVRGGTRAARAWSGRTMAALILAGWGAFNFVEGLIDHQILQVHHVRPGSPNQLLWDMLFLASGVGLVVVGWIIARTAPSSRAT